MDEEQSSAFSQELSHFIRNTKFPCVMAKAVEKLGRISICCTKTLLNDVSGIHHELSQFVDKFRMSEQLSSFILICEDERYRDLEKFEVDFWKFLNHLRRFDKNLHAPDPRVSDDPRNPEFSFSVKSEAFFILLLHPESPRWARRFTRPAIVFNAHAQFEALRKKGIFKKVQTIIRMKDKLLQGHINPMLSDFGEKSEVFQYVGRIYDSQESVPLIT